MSQRYFVETGIRGGEAELTGAEAHHLLHVMRGKRGDAVVLFDGSGREYDGRVEETARDRVLLRVTDQRTAERELPGHLTVAAPLPKGDRQRWLVEKAVELGVAELVPLQTARSVAVPLERALARLRRAVVEASKQCGRNRLMRIGAPAVWDDFARQQRPAGVAALLAHPGGEHSLATVARVLHSPDLPGAAAVVAAGPEGGFTPEEVALATQAGWQTIELGPRILRVETAALLLAALVNLAWSGADASVGQSRDEF